MNIGDKVRFLNDIGGGRITAFRPGGIVLVEDEDGLDVPVPQDEVVVIESSAPKVEKKKAAPKVVYGAKPIKEKEAEKKEESLNGKEYLQSKTVAPADEEDEIDEILEARVVRLDMTIQKLEATIQQLESRISRLEAENNLRKNEKMMARPKKPAKPAAPAEDLGKLEIL